MSATLIVEIDDNACRGCGMCAEDCPTEAVQFDESTRLAVVTEAGDCIACLSCTFICPSGAISLRGHHAVPNFYRNITFCERMERYL